MKIDIPPAGGIVPDAVVEYGGPLVLPVSYVARIKVIGVYTDRGFGHDEAVTVQNEVWRSETQHEREESAVAEAVNKLAEMLKGLI